MKGSLVGLDTDSTQRIAQAIGSTLSGQWVSGSTFYRVSFHAAKSLRILALLVLVFTVTGPVISAQEPTPFRWTQHEAIPRHISDAAVALNLGLDAWDSLYKTSSRERWGFACRLGLAVLTSEVLKRVIQRPRPDGSDDWSTPSEHTAIATATAGYRRPAGASVALIVGWGRMAGNKHYPSDVTFGAGLGLFSWWVCPR